MRKSLVASAVVILAAVILSGALEWVPHEKESELYYPETSAPPVLEFEWGPPPLILDPENSEIYSCGHPSVNPETGELNQEMSIFFVHRSRDPIYAFCDGVVTYLVEWENFEDAAEPGLGGEIWIRYGKNYAIGYRHVVTAGLNLAKGMIVKTGDIIGYGADLKLQHPVENKIENGQFFEFVLVERADGHYYYLNPFYFFDDESRTKLVEIWNATIRREGMENTPWGENQKFSSMGGNLEIPFKAGFAD